MYGRLEIRILSSRFEKICHKFSLLACNEYFTKNICEDVRATVQLSSDIQYQEIGAHYLDDTKHSTHTGTCKRLNKTKCTRTYRHKDMNNHIITFNHSHIST